MSCHKNVLSYSGKLLASSAVYLALVIPAAAQSSHVCSTDKVDRSVEIILPAYGSAVCKVLYRKPDEGASDQVVWRSNDSMASCEKHAQQLISKLTAEGFDCGAGALTAQRQSGEKVVAAPTTPVQAANQSAPAAPTVYLPYTRATDAKWHLAGYASANFAINHTDLGTNTNFSSAQFNPVFHFQYKDFLMLEAETEIAVNEEGETEFDLEYAQMDLFLNDSMTFVAGQFLSPVGEFQERLHPSWVNKLADAPAGFSHHDGAQPVNEVGAMLRGGVPVGSSIFTYAVAIGNGLGVNEEGGMEFESKGQDDNKNKTVSGRLGFLPVPNFEIGGSFLSGDVTGLDEIEGAVAMAPVGEPLEPTTAHFNLWGADTAYTRGNWDVRFEYLNSTRDPINTAFIGSAGVEMLPKLKLQAWYAQAAYRLSDITSNKVLQRFEPVFRYGQFKIKGLDDFAEEAAQNRFDFGLNYWLAPSIVARGVAQWRDYTAREDGEPSSETRYLFQFAYGF